MSMNNATTIEVDGRKSINALVFLEDSKHLLSGGEDGTIRQWRIDDGKEVEDQRLTAGGVVRAIAISRDGNWIVSTGNKIANVWDRRTRQIAHTSSEHSDWVNTVDVSADSTKYATGSYDRKAIIWAISNGKKLVELGPHFRDVVGVKFTPNGDRIVVAVCNYLLRFYDAYGGRSLKYIEIQDLSPSSPFAWSDDARHIFVLSGNAIQHRRDEGSLISEWTIPGHPRQSTQTGIALPNHGRFVAAFTGRTLTLWNTSTHVRLGPVLEHLHVDQLCSIALSPDNKYVATGSNDGTITLRNLNDLIPSSLSVDRTVTPMEAQMQTEAPNITPLAVESRSSDSTSEIIQPSDRIQVIVQHIPDGTYRIKSVVGDLYLTCPRAGTSTVVVQPLDRSSVSQQWTVSLVGDGAYEVTSSSELLLTVGMGAPLLVGPKDTTWTFDPRGDAYVIGNAVNNMALQLEPYPPSISVLPRNISPYQRWVLEFCEEMTVGSAGTSERDATSSRGQQRVRRSRGRGRMFTPWQPYNRESLSGIGHVQQN